MATVLVVAVFVLLVVVATAEVTELERNKELWDVVELDELGLVVVEWLVVVVVVVVRPVVVLREVVVALVVVERVVVVVVLRLVVVVVL
jgi:hypothetical protein